MTCSVDNCDGLSKSLGFCVKHYTRFLRYGSTETVLRPRGEAIKFYNELLSHVGDECVSWPFTTTSQSKRPWVQISKSERGNVARFLCFATNGEPANAKLQAAHSCGNEKCVNRNHIRWASPKDNAADKVIHGTVTNGSKHGASKLTESDVLEIRRLHGTMPNEDIAKLFGVKGQNISKIVKRQRWTHI